MKKASKTDLRSGIEWRKDRLALETAFLQAVRDTVENAARGQRLVAKIDRVLKVSREVLAERGETEPTLTDVQRQQAVIYGMIGPGFMFLPSFATQQPADFYIDDRCGRALYRRKSIYVAVETLLALAESHGMNAHALPAAPNFHNCGAW